MKKHVVVFCTGIFIGILIFTYNYFQKMGKTISNIEEMVDTFDGQKSISNLTKMNYNEVMTKEGLVLVDFYADWCGPCQMLSPIVEDVANEYDNVEFYKLDTDVEEEIANKYRIMSIPTLILFKNGEKIDESIGVISKEELIDFLNKNVDVTKPR